jgi:hypothetical protein
VIAQRIEYAYCSAQQLYNYVYNYHSDDETIMKQYYELQPYVSEAVSKLKYVYDQFSLISGGKSIAEYYEAANVELYKCPI